VSTFVDTSALLAVIHGSDKNHSRAARTWSDLLEADEDLVCTNYVLVETLALAQSRFGLAAVRDLVENVVPILRVVWIDAEIHDSAVAALLTANRRLLSLVDCVSFATMRRLSIDRAFEFDPHFGEQGFERAAWAGKGRA
jgi:predicted nucleic acid-binding protein